MWLKTFASPDANGQVNDVFCYFHMQNLRSTCSQIIFNFLIFCLGFSIQNSRLWIDYGAGGALKQKYIKTQIVIGCFCNVHCMFNIEDKQKLLLVKV